MALARERNTTNMSAKKGLGEKNWHFEDHVTCVVSYIVLHQHGQQENLSRRQARSHSPL
jgi:hypothetical protein